MSNSTAYKTFRYRLYPSKSQVGHLERTLALCCELYNAGLQERRDAYKLQQKNVTYVAQANQLPEIKKVRLELKTVHSSVLQDVLQRLDKAYKGFFSRVKARKGAAGFPRFRSHRRYDSITYSGSGYALNANTLRLSKIGKVKVKQHRPVEGVVKQVTISRTPTGKWFVGMVALCPHQLLPPNDAVVGVDVGIESFATLSTGDKIPNPRFFRDGEKTVAKSQRAVRPKVVQRVHERIANQRRDFIHKTSRALVSNFGVVVFEDLHIKGMVRNHNLSKSIHDAAWGDFIQTTLYKAEKAGRTCLQVNPRNTSKRCSACGTMVAKALSVREHRCPCGLVIDRDHNAAINIMTLGLQSLGCNTKEAPSLTGQGVATSPGVVLPIT